MLKKNTKNQMKQRKSLVNHIFNKKNCTSVIANTIRLKTTANLNYNTTLDIHVHVHKRFSSVL